QEAIIKKKGFYDALNGSWNIFKKQPFRVFIIWLLVYVVSILILIVFTLPLVLALMMMLLQTIVDAGVTTVNTQVIVNFLFSLHSQILLVLATGLLALIGFAVSKVFTLKAQTEFYMKLTKRFKFI
ncbi:MAG: hypothetical protein DRP15_04180, partial [Candidatus Aenigmatarchaeota archaeon]